MTQCKFCWAVVAAVGFLSILTVLKSIGSRTIDASSDGRVAIVVTPANRDLVLEEMRGLLEAVQTIIVANNAGDLTTVAIAGRKVGRVNMDPQSAEFAARLPMEFRKLGMDTHLRFDELAQDAEQFESTEHVSQQLGELTANCVACHRAYRLTTNDMEQAAANASGSQNYSMKIAQQ
jgi:redox-regulated HSP33 family molecular chaperone